MNTATVESSNSALSIMPLWNMVKDMDDDLKLELVAMLINSVRLHPTSTDDGRERGCLNLAGFWVNDHGDDDMETIIRKGREGRIGSRAIPSFDE